MKNEIYWTIAISVFIIALGICFKYYIETRRFIAPLVGHRVTTEGTILRPGLNWKNENGEDSSCHVRYIREDGSISVGERWNVGNCDINRKIQIEYNSYHF